MERFIVTDLTSFGDKTDQVCLAGLTSDGKHCFRPLPYYTYSRYRHERIRPGVTLEAEFLPQHHSSSPHTEDRQCRTIKVVQDFDANGLRHALLASSSQTLNDGFGAEVGLKHIPIDGAAVPSRSIITLAINPLSFTLRTDNYGKLKADFSDGTGIKRAYIPVRDIGLINHIQTSKNKLAALTMVNQHIKSQQSLLLRVGIGRPWKSDDGRNGFWLQVNATFCFPNLHQCIAEY